MKNILKFILLISLLITIGCVGVEKIETDVIEDINYFRPLYHNEIAIFPTYKYLGSKSVNIEKSIAIREYHVWKHNNTDKYILITTLRPKDGTFKKDIKWINRKNTIYSQGNIVAYNTVHKRAATIIYELGGSLPDCLIITQEFYFHEKEVLYKSLIVPDEFCAEEATNVVRELNRVANMQP